MSSTMLGWAVLVVLAMLVVVAVAAGPRERYQPNCGSKWDNGYRIAHMCWGDTAGTMPVIEEVLSSGNGLCCGVLGIPP